MDKDSSINFKKKEMIDLNILREVAKKAIDELPCEKEMVTDEQLILFLSLFDDDSKLIINYIKILLNNLNI